MKRGRKGHPSKGALAEPGELVIGKNAVREVLRHSSHRAAALLVSDRFEARQSEEFLLLAKPAGIPVRTIPVAELTARSGSDSHQGVALELHPREWPRLNDFLERVSARSRSLVIALDGVTDPHNFGAILRAAECFGVEGVLWSKNRGPGITPAVTKVSAGASELVPVCSVSNLVDALRRFKEAGFWVAAADSGPESQDVAAFERPEKLVLVLGAEGAGVSRLVGETADFSVRIPMAGVIDSLNVSQAAAVLLHVLMQTRVFPG